MQRRSALCPKCRGNVRPAGANRADLPQDRCTCSDKDYCGIIFIGGGSTHAYGPTPQAAAEKAAEWCKRDWKTLFAFKKQEEFKVCVYDMKLHDGWYADCCAGVMDDKTHEPIPIQEMIKETV